MLFIQNVDYLEKNKLHGHQLGLHIIVIQALFKSLSQLPQRQLLLITGYATRGSIRMQGTPRLNPCYSRQTYRGNVQGKLLEPAQSLSTNDKTTMSLQYVLIWQHTALPAAVQWIRRIL